MIIKITIESPNGAKMNLSFEVPDGSNLVTSCDTDYLSHQDHPEYRETGNLKIETADFRKKAEDEIQEKIADVPARKYLCEHHGVFLRSSIKNQEKCIHCENICDLLEPVKEDYESIPCITCSKIYKKSTGGKYGTCPSCTMVRCPTCKNPATLEEMQGGQKCKSCRGEA